MRKQERRRKGRAVLAVLTAGCLFLGQPLAADAVRSITEIQKEQDELQDELDSLDAELVSVLTEIANMEAEIAEKETEIANTEAELVLAQEAVDRQYDAMKVRIQYMYENSDKSMLSVLLESGSIADFLNRVEYMNSVYSYDRDTLDSYEATRREVADMKTMLEEERVTLVASQQSLEAKESELDSMIASKEGEMEDIEGELEEAKEAAARQAELERQAQALAAQQAAGAGGSSAGANTSGSSSAGVTGDLNPSQTTGVSGDAVVAYAKQFVGCKYTWGGTDPVNGGADCSGFVYYVYKHFGINYGRLTSAGFRRVGQEVSYNNIQPGDVVCYAGHVAIYAGGGVIVEAQSSATGITCYRSVNCHPIITIRRLV